MSQPAPKVDGLPKRVVGLAGLLSFVLIGVAALVAPPLWNMPGTGASDSAIAAFFRTNSTRAAVSLFIYSLAVAFILCLAAGLWSFFRQREPSPQTLSSLFALAGSALAVLILTGFAPAFLLSYRNQPAATARLLADMTFGFLALSGIPTAVFLAAYAALVLRLGGLPRWTAYLAALSASAHVLIAAAFLSHGAFLSLESEVIVWVPGTFFAWILVVSAVLLRGGPLPAPR